MERIAFLTDSGVLGWNALILTLAAAAAVCIFLALYLLRDGDPIAGFPVIPLALALSLLGARALHWYVYPDRYPGFWAAVTDFSSGGFALAGVFAGCILAAVLLRLTRLERNLPRLLDCMAVAGAAGITVGRMASLFDASDRGRMVESLRNLPWVYPVTNVTSGATEYRLATFMLQAMVALALFAVLAVFLLTGERRKLKDGDTALIFLLCYGASQILLDSTRYDSMYFRSNGFVSIEQVLGLVMVLLAVAVFSVRLVRSRGFRKWYLTLWAGTAGLLGGAGYMEYYVQRHGNEAVFAYSIMGTCLALTVGLTLAIRFLARIPPERE